MTDLTRIGASAVRAYQSALATVAENVANRDSVGYVRRDIALAELAPAVTARGGAGSGVRVAGINRAWDSFRADVARNSLSDKQQAALRSEALQRIETLVGGDSNGVGIALTALFDSATQLAADPGSIVGRADFKARLDGVAAAFRQTATGLTDQADANQAARASDIALANRAFGDLARVNEGLRSTRPGSDERAALEDQRDRLIDSVAGIVKVDVAIDGNGAARITATGLASPPLVDGALAATIATTDGGDLLVSARSGSGILTPIGGTLAGYRGAADAISDFADGLDSLAVDVVDAINRWSAQGRAPDGAAGSPLLSGTSAATIAAVDTGIDRLPLASADGQRNGNLLALAALRVALAPEDRWNRQVDATVLATQDARATADVTASVHDQNENAVAVLSAVDLDTEAASLLRFQQAHGAAAHILKVAQETLDSILQLG